MLNTMCTVKTNARMIDLKERGFPPAMPLYRFFDHIFFKNFVYIAIEVSINNIAMVSMDVRLDIHMYPFP